MLSIYVMAKKFCRKLLPKQIILQNDMKSTSVNIVTSTICPKLQVIQHFSDLLMSNALNFLILGIHLS